ncbi:hypothetical protein D3C72_1853780 [compost metagenome]
MTGRDVKAPFHLIRNTHPHVAIEVVPRQPDGLDGIEQTQKPDMQRRGFTIDCCAARPEGRAMPHLALCQQPVYKGTRKRRAAGEAKYGDIDAGDFVVGFQSISKICLGQR